MQPVNVVVFLGPSCPVDRARAVLDAHYLPPADHGAVHRALSRRPAAIVLVDGVFPDYSGHRPVGAREVLDAVEDGIPVIGAAGVGARLAAEWETMGVRGHGQVFSWYRSGALDAADGTDDDIALRHEGAEVGYRALSEPLVNIRATLAAAVRAEVLPRSRAGELIGYARSLNHPLRRWKTLLSAPLAAGWTDGERERLIRFVGAHRVDVAKADTLGALRVAARLAGRRQVVPLAGPAARWPSARRFSGGVSSSALVTRARVEVPDLVSRLRRRVARRGFALDWAREHGVRCPETALPRFARDWADEHRLEPDEAWLRESELTAVDYWRLLTERADADWVTTHPGPLPGMHRHPGTAALPGEDRAVLAWALLRGVLTSVPRSVEEQLAAARRIVRRGPGHFGVTWDEEAALVEELRMTGVAAELSAPPLEAAI